MVERRIAERKSATLFNPVRGRLRRGDVDLVAYTPFDGHYKRMVK